MVANGDTDGYYAIMRSRSYVFAVVLSVTLLIGTGSVSAEPIVQSSERYHYSYVIPEGWRQIPNSTLDEYIRVIASETDVKNLRFTAGFHLAGKGYFEYPYILTQEHNVDTPSYDQIQRSFEKGFGKGLTKISEDLSEYAQSIDADEPYIDQKRNIVFTTIDMDVTGVGQVRGLVAIFLGRQSMVQLNFYATRQQYNDWLPVFQETIDSFHFESGYEYNPVVAEENDPHSIPDALRAGAITAIVGAGLGALFAKTRLWVRLQKSGRPKKPARRNRGETDR